ncbi:aminotransferase class I/II-fold pyridoxal phosphate-dependent enzyme [Aquibaculum arenosum]|uniref:Aminotransferase class I/II-fold pyridoxal phosphate-dependent enzyme n=1 Tax=Aquibaculum arenosum TaxID=3032591 RepID=A0ABT5YPI5_9PROT|nr:aminotransferase class I/II-fold pyridoxal phosphate-dependent enzyme [Fodinicurvata sp. CAU 1616]MDF2096794.1 aminotransferase class I/II-fold pyridoxal phosphate-dependent enzyme [Fodinicurvata sp. CAU 1616]
MTEASRSSTPPANAAVAGDEGPLRVDPRSFHPFLRLARLLEGVEPGRSPLPDGKPINLSIGDPQLAAPPLVAKAIAQFPGDWSRYPPFRGPESYRKAAVGWLNRRYGLPAGFIEEGRHLLPIPGSREGLFFATLAAINLGAAEGRTKVLIPAPGYHVYVGGAVAAGAEPVFVPVSRETGFLPDFSALDPDILDRTAIAFLCSPSNPEGAVADKAQWSRMIALARQHGFTLAADECYTDVYTDTPPAGVLEAAADSGSLDRVLSFQSLSKRSSAAGLRCGFVAGEQGMVDAIDAFFRYGGAGVPVPILEAGAALWDDEAHVAETRGFYQNLFTLAERKLGNRFGWTKPAGGFFLWLEVGDGEAAAKRLWQEAGIRTLPGGYLCARPLPDGNPGERFIRVALVYGPEVTEPALDRLIEVLG